MKKHLHEFRFGLIFFLLLICSFPAYNQTRTTKGTEFWLAYSENLQLSFNGPPMFDIYITADVTTKCTVSFPAGLGSSSFIVAAGQTYDYYSKTILYAQGDDTISKKGIKITADHPVQVHAIHFRAFFSDGTMVLPVTELTDNYMIITKNDTASNHGGKSEFVVLATSDNTVIDIDLQNNSLKGHNAHTIFKKTLNAGETYQAQSNFDLSGSVIQAEGGKKIAVFSGATYTSILYGCGSTSYIYDEDIPTKYWGTYYAAVPFKDQPHSLIKILANNDHTTVQINCQSIILNKGQSYESPFGNPLIISADKTIAVAQFVSGGSCDKDQLGDPNMLVLQPLTNMLQGSVTFQPPSWAPPAIFAGYPSIREYLTIICQTKNKGLISINGAGISDSFSAFPVNSRYSYARLTINSTSKTIYSDSFFYAYTYELSQFDAVTFSLGYITQRPIDTLYIDSAAALRDTTLCPGKTWTLPLHNILVKYPDGSVKTGNIIPDSGHYEVRLNDCKSPFHKIRLAYYNVRLQLGPDTILCAGTNDTLHLPVAAGVAYTWQDSSHSNPYIVKTSGRYWVQTRQQGCKLSDTIIIKYDSVINLPKLPADTGLCTGKNWMIDLQYIKYPVKWQDGDSSKKYVIKTAGTYTIKSGNVCGQVQKQVKVVYYDVKVNLGNDTALCTGNSLKINLPANGQAYLWQDGSTDSFFTIQKAGTYWVRSNMAQCAQSDTVHVKYDSIPPKVMPEDTLLCPGDSFTIDASKIKGRITWQDGSNSKAYTITAPGNYFFELQNACGHFKQSLKVSKKSISLNLGPDVKTCVTKSIAFDIHQPGCTYQWSDGSTLPTFTAHASGTYWAMKKTAGCVARDTVQITYDYPLTKNFLGADTEICRADTLKIHLDSLGGTLRWSDGSIKPDRRFTERGKYTATITNACGVFESSIHLKINDCDCETYFPNSFTPNKDSFNERFRMEADCKFLHFNLNIYNRWGELIFSADDPAKAWDGTFKGGLCPEGVYMWQMKVETNHLQPIYKSGTVTILR